MTGSPPAPRRRSSISTRSRRGSARAERRLAALGARRAELEREEAAARRSLELARADVDEAERRLGNRLRELYVQGEVDPLAVILAAESLDDALSAFDGLTRLADQDRSHPRGAPRVRGWSYSARSVRSRERSAELRQVVARAEAEQAALASARAEREAYIAGLAARRALNGRQLARLSAQAAEASVEAPEPRLRARSRNRSRPTPSPAGTQMVVDVVAYCGGVGTASGLPLGWGTVAVDTRVFPFGTKMYIPGYGDGVAADTGSAIIGRIIDIWFPTCAQAPGVGPEDADDHGLLVRQRR